MTKLMLERAIRAYKISRNHTGKGHCSSDDLAEVLDAIELRFEELNRKIDGKVSKQKVRK